MTGETPREIVIHPDQEPTVGHFVIDEKTGEIILYQANDDASCTGETVELDLPGTAKVPATREQRNEYYQQIREQQEGGK